MKGSKTYSKTRPLKLYGFYCGHQILISNERRQRDLIYILTVAHSKGQGQDHGDFECDRIGNGGRL